jgi:hypothetical protein
MICDLSQNNLREHLEKYVGALIDYSIKNDPQFDYSKIISTVYSDVKGKRNDHIQALGVAYHVPTVIEEFISTNKKFKKSEFADKGYDPTALLKQIAYLKSAYDPIDAIAGILGVKVMDIDEHEQIISNTPPSESDVKGPIVMLGIEGMDEIATDKKLIPKSYNTTTGETAIEKKVGDVTVKSLGEIDPDKLFYDEIQRNLLAAKKNDDTDFTNVEFGGHKGFRARLMFERNLPLDKIRPNRESMLDKNILVLVITDNNGNILYFKDDGTAGNENNGKPAYSFIRSTIGSAPNQIIDSLVNSLDNTLPQEQYDKAVKEITDQVWKDVNRINNYKSKLRGNPDELILVDIVGGFKGAITNPDNLKANEEEAAAKTLNEFNLSKDEKNSISYIPFSIGGFNFTIPAIKFDNYDKLITLKNRKLIGEQDPELLENIVSVLIDDVEINGKKLTDLDKLNYVNQFINLATSKKETEKDYETTRENLKRYTIATVLKGTKKELFISLDGTPLDLSNKDVAKKVLREFLGKNAYVHFHTNSYTNKTYDHYNLSTGKKEVRDYYAFISTKLTPRIIMDVKTKRPIVLNSYLTFEPIVPKSEIKEEVKQTTEQVKENNIATTPEKNEEDYSDLMRSNLLESLATTSQISEAEKWWNESSLSKAVDENGKPLFNLNLLRNVVNSDAWADFSRGVITLYKGSDYTHVYHEAWHAFSQTYLTYAERTELYNALGKLKGSFVGIKKIAGPDGVKYVKENISFDSASRRELEEFIAEEFRSYAMNKGKFVTKSKSSNILVKLFDRIWKALKALVGADTNVYSNPDAQGVLTEMFSTLYNAKNENSIIRKPSLDNQEFGNLNAGVVSESGDSKLSVSESLLFTKILDGIISDKITTYVKKGAYSAATALFKSAEKQEQIFKEVIQKLNDRRIELLKELNATTDSQKKIILDNKITLLTTAIKDDIFGDIREVITGKSKKSSLLAFHRNNSTFKDMYTALSFDTEADDAIDEADEGALSKGDGRFDTPINGLPSEKLASGLVLTIIKSLTKQKKDGSPDLNELGFAEPIEFKPFWRVLIDKAAGETSVLGLYNKLKLAGKEVSPLFQQLLDKIYSTKIVKDDKGNDTVLSVEDTFADMFTKGTGIGDLWMKLVQSLNLHRIDLAPVVVKQKDGKFEVRSGITTAENKRVIKDWSIEFQQQPQGPFITKKDQTNRLNLNKIIETYVIVGKSTDNKNTYNVSKENYIPFLNAVGIYITKNQDIQSILEPRDVDYIATSIGRVYEYNKSLPAGSDKVVDIEDPIQYLSADRELPNGTKIKTTRLDISYLADLEAEFSEEYSSQMRPTPDGNTKSVVARNNSDTQKINAIRKAGNLSDLYSNNPEMVHMNYLNPESNPLSKGLVLLKSLFSQATGEKIENNNLHIRDLAGSQFIMDDESSVGTTHSKMSKTDKFITNLLSTLYSGYMETVVPGDKSSYFALKLDNISTYKGKKTNYLYIDTSAFLRNANGEYITGYNGMSEMLDIMYPKLEAEIKRIAMFKEDAKLPEDQQYYSKIQGLSRGTEFDIFDDILNSKTENLKTYLRSDEFIDKLNKAGDLTTVLAQDKALKAKLDTQITSYFNNLYKQYMKDLFIPTFGQEISPATQDVFNNVVKKGLSEKELANLGKTDAEVNPKIIEAAVMSYMINNFIHKTETTVLFQGDGIQFDHTKDELTKRTSGSQSGGGIFSVDKLTKIFVDSKVGRLIEKKLLDKGVISKKNGAPQEPRTYGPTLNTAIIKESEVNSEYFDMYRDLFRKDFEKRGIKDKSKLDAALYGVNPDTGKPGSDARDAEGNYIDIHKGGKMQPFTNIQDGDGQGWITLDTYRILKRVEGNWSDEQEKAYMKIVNDEVITPDEITELFPVYKLQYYGPLATERGRYPVQAFHKFSLMPLIPSVIKGFPAEKMNNAMMAQNIDYALFKSGSKRSFIKSSKDSKGDDIYTGNTSNIKDTNEIEFTPNPIYISYLKNQTEVNAYYKEKSTFSTQLRKLLTSGLYENEVPVDFIKNYKSKDAAIKAWSKLSEKEKEEKSEFHRLSNDFIQNLDDLVEYKKQELLDDLQWTIDPKTKEPVGDIQNMITFLVKELKRQGFSDHEISIISTSSVDTDKDSKNTFKPTDFSVSPLAARFEKLLMAVINNRLIKLKMKGEPLVEGSSAFMQSYSKPTKFRNATEEEKAKYDNFGTNGLKSYVVDVEGNKPTLGFGFKRAFTDSDMGLLQTTYFTKNEKGEYVDSKQTIAVYDENKKLDFQKSFERLNEMLLVDEWLNTDENKKKIRLTGVRIPVQGINSMEFGQVAEFLLPDAGPVIIIPAEIVAKSGTDFDVDKMTTYLPHVSRNGTLFKKTTKQELENRIATLEEKFKKLSATKTELKELKDKKSEKWLNIGSSLSEFRKEVTRASKSMFVGETTLKDFTNKKNRELIETLSNPKNEEYLKQWFPKAYSIYKEKIKGATVEDIKLVEETIKKLLSEKTELSSVYKEMSDALELQQNFSAGIENALIESMTNILSLPYMAASLMSPNDTNLVKPVADKLKGYIQEADNETDFTKSIMTGEKVASKGVSSTSIYTETYNIKKQQENSAGKGSLGIAAIENYMNNLLNMAGATMKSTMLVEATVEEKGKRPKKDFLPVPIDIYLKTNKLDGELSMSHILDADGINSIADIISQLMNGFVDVGKDAWVAYIQGNLEVVPKILWMIEVGVPMEDIAYFVSNPLTRKYVEEVKRRKSTLSNLVYGPFHERMSAKQNALETVLQGEMLSPEYYLNEKNKNIYGIHKALEAVAKPEYFDKKVLEQITRSKADPKDQAQLAGLLQYLYIEELIKEYEEMKKEFTPDTKTSTDLYTASARISGLKKVRSSQSMDPKTTDYVVNKSVISPFFLQEFARKLFSRLFKLRDDSRINDFLINHLNNKSSSFKSKAKTGYDSETYVVKFKNFISQYIFAQNLRQYRFDSTTYNNKKIDPKLLAQANEDFDNKLYDPTSDALNSYKNRGLASVNPAAFANAKREEFIEFVLERENLRQTTPLSYLVDTKEFEVRKARLLKTGYSIYNKKADESAEQYNDRLNTLTYEDWLANTALKNTYNTWQLFKSGDNTIARELMDIIKNYPEIGENTNYSILQQFIDTGVDDKKYRNVLNFQLKNYSNLDEGLIDEYYNQWKKLASNEPKLIGENEKTRKANIYISKFFENLPLIAFLQSGMESGQFSLSSVMPYEKYKNIMEQASEDFLNKLESNPSVLLEEIRELFEEEHSTKNSKLRKRAINLKKDINLLPSEDFNIENQPFITKKDEGVYIINKTYYGNGMTNIVGMDIIKKLSSSDGETIYLLSPADVLKYAQVYLTGEDVNKAKNDVKILIDTILNSGFNVAIYPEGFMANPNPLPAKSQSYKEELGKQFGVGSFVKYQGQEYIVTKKLDNNKWQIYSPLKTGAESKLPVLEKNLQLTGLAAKKVTYRGSDYLVTPKNSIISLTTNTLMNWKEGDGNRRDILALANASRTDQVQESVKPVAQPISNTKNFNKKNLFTVTPQEGVSDKKAKVKASIATQYIGFGEDIIGKDGKRSSTQIYREQAGALANTGNYSSNDVIFVSVPGLRGNAEIAKREQDKTIKEAIKALEAGATILTDNKAYTDASSYNTGEQRLYKNLEAKKDYQYSEITIDGQVLGTWSKSTQPSTEALDFKTMPEFTIDRKREILTNFAKAFKMTTDKAYEYINNALNTKGKEVVLRELNKKDQYGNNCY